MSLGTLLKSRRKSLNLSQDDVAKQLFLRGCTIDQSYISQVERGKIDFPSREILLGLADVLDLPVMEMLRSAGYVRDGELQALDDAELAKAVTGMSPGGRAAILAAARAIRETEEKYRVRGEK